MRSFLKNRLKNYFLYKKYRISFIPNYDEKIVNVIMFDGRTNHGGLVDRLKGIITSYEASKFFPKSKFKIFHKSPFDLTNYLLPNDVNWEMDESELNFSYPRSKIIYNMDYYNYQFFLDDYRAKNNRIHGQNHIYTNLDYTNHIKIRNNEISWKDSFFELFKYSDYLNEILSKYDTSECIGIHARFGSLLGDFKDTGLSYTGTKDEIESEIVESKEIINKIIFNYPNHNVFLFSDSNKFIMDCKSSIKGINTTEGISVHTDTMDIKQNHDKTFLDFFLLTKCKAVFQLKSKKMYQSQFSKYASIIGSSQFEVMRY